MDVRPLRDKVLLKRIDAPETTKGGIIIPDTAAEKPQEGKIFAVGNGYVMEDGTVKPLAVKKGDRVLFGQYGGTEINIGGEDYIILEEKEIVAILD